MISVSTLQPVSHTVSKAKRGVERFSRSPRLLQFRCVILRDPVFVRSLIVPVVPVVLGRYDVAHVQARVLSLCPSGLEGSFSFLKRLLLRPNIPKALTQCCFLFTHRPFPCWAVWKSPCAVGPCSVRCLFALCTLTLYRFLLLLRATEVFFRSLFCVGLRMSFMTVAA